MRALIIVVLIALLVFLGYILFRNDGGLSLNNSPTPTVSVTATPTPTATITATPAISGPKMTVYAYFGNSRLNPDIMDCSLVFPVARQVPQTQAVARAALNELFTGPNADEKALGFYTSINSGVQIQSLTIENGVAKADFAVSA